ncbi:hypothetical protein NQ318_014769 [Aromia moschata]|uniref:Uncharacterized protein n=1 Tax=Aromia moschata TaxID=1265417 RepID=A0AAV8ZDS5_9CUCU|nr:hypothetical protein NQ318_014769 [Aromia moschata]
MEFTAWVDAVIFVFSLENESSFNAIYNYYTKMSHYRNTAEIPLILVGTQDAISENNPRVIDDSRARKLANDLKRCTYYETCATYGLNVERVFQDVDFLQSYKPAAEKAFSTSTRTLVGFIVNKFMFHLLNSLTEESVGNEMLHIPLTLEDYGKVIYAV